MKLSFKSLSLLAFGVLLTACTDNEGLPIDEGQQNSAKSVLNWGVHILSHGTSPSINADAADKEDQVDNIVLAGSAANAYTPGSSSATFGVPRFSGKKNFFFAANLNATDRAAVGAGHTETDFNNILLNTMDYLRQPIGTKPLLEPIPMTATLRDIEVDASGNFKTRNTSGALVNADQVDFTRAFAKVELEIFNPGDFKIEKVVLCNVPSKFALAAPIQNYDKTGNGYTNVVLYNDPSHTGALHSMGTVTKTFYIPELVVTAPSFHEQLDRGMMYVAVHHGVDVTPGEKYITAYRIGDPTLSSPNYGKVLRNHVYKLKVRGSDAKRTANPASPTTPVTYFAN